MFPEVEAGLRHHFTVNDIEAIRLALGIDVRWLHPLSYRLAEHPELSGLSLFGTDEARLFSFGDAMGEGRPLQGVETVAEIENSSWPDPDWFDYDSVTRLARHYQDYGLVAPSTWTPLFCRISELCGMEDTLILLLQEPILIEAMVEQLENFYTEYLTRILDAAPGQIDIMFTGDDVAGQEGMLFSLETWRRFFKEPYARIFQVAKDRGVQVMFHVCGSCMDVIPDLLDIGMDILQVLQFSARRMDPRSLKAEFGQDLCFCGGVDVQQLLPHGTTEQVRAEVRLLIDTLGKGGGYILGPAHSLLDDVPVENVLAMYDEARRYRSSRSSGPSCML
jgi:uroporphyrinogen decarboxylase